jgi:hypothetical protein
MQLFSLCNIQPEIQTMPYVLQLDLEFETLQPDCPDFLNAFPATIEKIIKYGEVSSIPMVRQSVQAAANVETGKP